MRIPLHNLQFLLKYVHLCIFTRCKRVQFSFMSQISWRFESNLRRLMMGRKESSSITDCPISYMSCIVIKCLCISLKKLFRPHRWIGTFCHCTSLNLSSKLPQPHDGVCICAVFISQTLAPVQTET